jgi:hypothetical protein
MERYNSATITSKEEKDSAMTDDEYDEFAVVAEEADRIATQIATIAGRAITEAIEERHPERGGGYSEVEWRMFRRQLKCRVSELLMEPEATP